MKKGDIVRFRNEVDPGDTRVRMILLEDLDGGRALVGDVCIVEDSGIKQAVTATSRYPVEDFELVSGEDMTKLGRSAI